jgi:very-short-patch-repair endonuclease
LPRKSIRRANKNIVQAARKNRQGPTLAEARLWDYLRGRRLAGLKFRRQHPIDRFVLDFFCLECMLAVEVDGGIHLTPDQLAIDEERTRILDQMGIKVLRFSNHEIIDHVDDVLNRILLNAKN